MLVANEDTEALLTMQGHTNCIYALNCDIEGEEGKQNGAGVFGAETIRLQTYARARCLHCGQSWSHTRVVEASENDLEASSDLPSSSGYPIVVHTSSPCGQVWPSKDGSRTFGICAHRDCSEVTSA